MTAMREVPAATSQVPTRLHAGAGALALICIGCFWIATVVAEASCSHACIAELKHGIWLAMGLLIPSLIVTGASGFALARRRHGQLVSRKRRRMPFVALNGALILLPCAYYLQLKAGTGQVDGTFVAAQLLELGVGAINFVLLGMNFRDGLRLTGRLAARHANR